MALHLPYTICFCQHKDKILMLFRNSLPNQYLWNGLGGKLEANESPREGIYREVLEEAGIDLNHAEYLRFSGLVTWANGVDPTSPSRGMYAFVTKLPESFETWSDEIDTPEGLLAWKEIAWVCDKSNSKVVSNIPYFLPPMLAEDEPQEYFCDFEANGLLKAVVAKPIEQILSAL